MTGSHDGCVHRREAVLSNNDPFHAKFHESPPGRWPRQHDLGGDAYPRPRSGGASCFPEPSSAARRDSFALSGAMLA